MGRDFDTRQHGQGPPWSTRSIDDGLAILERLVVRDCYKVDFGSPGGLDNLSRTIALRMDMQVDFEPPATNRLFIGERFYEVECSRVEGCLSPISNPRLPIGQLCRQARGQREGRREEGRSDDGEGGWKGGFNFEPRTLKRSVGTHAPMWDLP